MPVYIDYRERALIALDPTAKIITPPVGDLWIGVMSSDTNDLLSGGVILERKTAADLEASILDGRYSEQRGRLLAYANQHKVAIGYVIEGNLEMYNSRLSASALLKHITRLQFHHRIPVLQTSGAQETMRLATLIDEQWAQDKGQFSWQSDAGCASTPVAMSYVKSASRDTPEAFFIGTLCQCRGVSEGLARIIVAQYKSLDELLKATEDELALVSDPGNPKRKVGKAVAKRLYGLLHNL